MLGILAAVSGQLGERRFAVDARFHNTYFVAAHFHYFLAVGAAFLIFAALYLALEQARRGRWRRLLGGLHFAASFVGANLIFLPQHLLGLAGDALADLGGVEGFFLFNNLASAGYLTVLAGQLFFVAVLIDAFRRGPDLR